MQPKMSSSDNNYWLNFFSGEVGQSKIDFDPRSLFLKMDGKKISPFALALEEDGLTFDQISELDDIYELCVGAYIKTRDRIGMPVSDASGYLSFALLIRGNHSILAYFSQNPTRVIGVRAKLNSKVMEDSLLGQESVLRLCLSSGKFMTLERILTGMNSDGRKEFKALLSKSNYSVIANYFFNSQRPCAKEIERIECVFSPAFGKRFLKSNMKNCGVSFTALRAFSEFCIFHDRCGIDDYSEVCRWLVSRGENIYKDKNNFSFIDRLSVAKPTTKSKSCLIALIEDGADLTHQVSGTEIFSKISAWKNEYTADEKSIINSSYLSTKFFNGHLKRAENFCQYINLKDEFFNPSRFKDLAERHSRTHSFVELFNSGFNKLNEETIAEKITEAIYDYAGDSNDIESFAVSRITRFAWNLLDGKADHEIKSILRDALAMTNKNVLAEKSDSSIGMQIRLRAILDIKIFVTRKMLENEGHPIDVIKTDSYEEVTQLGRKTLSFGYLWGRIPMLEPDNIYLEKEYGIKFNKLSEKVRFLDEAPGLF